MDSPVAALALAAAAFAVQGCGAKFHSIHRIDTIAGGDGQVLYTDAKQKALTAIKVNPSNAETWRICLEPSPDVFSAFANSLSASASLDSAADPATRQASAALSAAINESAATIERSQTINMLREAMYRTCERYMSGAINRHEFVVQSARDQRVMVATLAIEQLTGAHRAQATALAASSRATTAGPGEASLQLLAAARAGRDKSAADATTAADKLAAAAPADTSCEAIQQKDTPSDEEKAKLALCAQAAKLAAVAADAKRYYDTLHQAIDQRSAAATAAVSEHRPITAAFNPTAITDAQLGQTVLSIVNSINNFDELRMTCVVLLRGLASEQNTELPQAGALGDLTRACAAQLGTEVELAREQLEQQLIEERAATRARVEQLNAQQQSAAHLVWRRLRSMSVAERSAWLDDQAAARGYHLRRATQRAMASAADFAAFNRAFGQINGADTRAALAAAASEELDEP